LSGGAKVEEMRSLAGTGGMDSKLEAAAVQILTLISANANKHQDNALQ
jgi:hypothetical protein